MWYWLMLAALCLALEIATGTLALLFAALGAGVAALLAWLGDGGEALQIVVFALGAVAGTLVARLRLRHQPPPAADNPALGQEVSACQLPGPAGRLRVRWRGTEWPARLADPEKAPAVTDGGLLTIVATEGSTLVVAPR